MRRLLPLGLLILLAGCTKDATQPYTEDEMVVFGYLYVGETVSSKNGILVTRARPIEEPYDFEDALVRDAIVTIRREEGTDVDTLQLTSEGSYANADVVIEEETTYHLGIEIDGEVVVQASTTTPTAFDVSRGPVEKPETMVHGEIPDSFPIMLSCPNEEQIFLVDVYCREEWEDARYVHPIGPTDEVQSYQEYGYENDPPRHLFAYFRIQDIEQEEGEYRIGWYGDMMVFYGEYDVGILSIDLNYYNYLYRDHPELNGGIEGGIGVFGSACRRQYSVEAIEP